MSRVVIFHGTECKPNDFWYMWLKQELEKLDHSVDLRHYPDINRSPIEEFVQNVMNENEFTDDTILVGHSAGVPLILSILERLSVPVKRALLVAGFVERLSDDENEPILQSSYDWDRIRSNARDFVIFNSVNDPWGCTDVQGRKIFEGLGGTLIIRNDGHFGSSKDPEYKQFPLLLEMIEAEL